MSNKILFLISEHQPYFELLAKEATEQGVELDFCLYQQVIFSYQNQNTQVLVNHKDIREYDVVYFRNTDPQHEKHIGISEYCQNHSINILDPALAYRKPWVTSKNFSYIRLSENKLPVIDSFFVTASNFTTVLTKLKFPLIAKITTGSQGKGVHLCNSAQEIEDLFVHYQKDLLLQEFIQNQGDIRAFVIGNQVIGAMKRKAALNEFRNNVSLGGSTEAYDLNSDAIKLVLEAVKVMEYTMAGVDLVYDQQNSLWKIIEINRAPQYLGIMNATGINLPQVIVSYFANYKS